MIDQSHPESSRETRWPFVLQSVPEPLQVQMDTWLNEQAQLFDETQKLMGAWMKRRQEAVDTAFRTFQSACSCKDAGSVAALYGEWLTGSMNRIIADLNDARDEALRLAAMGQKSASALWQQGAREDAPAASAVPAAAERGARRAKNVPRTAPVHEAGEDSATE